MNMPVYCVYDEQVHCMYCGNCGKPLCRETTNEPCNDCGNCEYGGVTIE